MRVLVCVKRVPAPGAKIVLTPDRQDIDSTLLGFTVSPHEECALEEAVQIVERQGGSVTVMTLGPPEAEEQLRSAVAVGATTAVLLPTRIPDWDPVSTANALSAAIRTIENEQGEPFDLIMFGNESADACGYQVGIRVARALGRPIVSGIKGIDTHEEAITARRDTPSGSEVYRLPLPAVVAVKEGINLPRYPTLKGRMMARRAPVSRIEPTPGTSGQSKVTLVTPSALGTKVNVLGEGPQGALAVVDVLEGLGLV